MKVLSLAEVSAVSGAGDMPEALQKLGFDTLLSYLKYGKETGIDPLSSKLGGVSLGIGSLYREWCNNMGFDAEKSAELNGWTLN